MPLSSRDILAISHQPHTQTRMQLTCYTAGGGVYCATKFAVDAYTTATRHDLVASSNVRVSAISPGAVNTDFSTVRFAGDRTKADAVYQVG